MKFLSFVCETNSWVPLLSICSISSYMALFQCKFSCASLIFFGSIVDNNAMSLLDVCLTWIPSSRFPMIKYFGLSLLADLMEGLSAHYFLQVEEGSCFSCSSSVFTVSFSSSPLDESQSTSSSSRFGDNSSSTLTYMLSPILFSQLL